MGEPAVALEFREVTPERWPDLARLFEARGGPHYCWCMAWRPRGRGGTESKPDALRRVVERGTPVGLLAYEEGEPVAWCSIAPRESYRELGGPAEPAGVAVWSRQPMKVLGTGLGDGDLDPEGRVLRVKVGDLRIVSIYLPSGSSGDHRQAEKEKWMARFMPWAQKLVRSRVPTVLGGDFNIAHTERDLKNWRNNRKNSGFLPEERAWLDTVFGELGWVDTFRSLHPEAEGEAYTWWSQRGAARAKNVGWRIDYQICTPGIAGQLQAMRVYKDQKLSDHAPLIGDYAAPALRSAA